MSITRIVSLHVCLTGLVVGPLLAVQDGARRGEVMLNESFSVNAGGTLRVDVGDGDVDVVSGGNGVEVEVRVWARDAEWARDVFDRMAFEVGTSGNGVSVTSRDPRIRRDEWRRHRGVGVSVTIRVPERYNLDIHTSDGDVTIEDLTGSIDVRTSDGDVRLGDVAGPEVLVQTSDGDVFAGNIQSRRMELRTSDGDVEVRSATGEVNVRTSDGDIVVRFAEIAGVRLSTQDGDITMYAPETLAAELTLEGEDLELDRDITVRGRVSRRSIRGTLNGGGPLIHATTNDGSIALRRN